MVVQVEEPEQDYCSLRRPGVPSLVEGMPAETQNGGGGAPRASLLCRPNSHPFQDRMLSLDQPVKVGRSVARARPVQTNAIFDCKVLSRNHALLWYENGKFYLQDTKSSNGTFVNNQRLSKGSEESPPREVCSGDILQFGVDVMENSRKVTHGCIIATLKLYLPDGKEAKASPSIVNSSPGAAIPAQDLYQLNQYIQEALAREQFLENKLLSLQRLIGDTETASSAGWRALMDEDRLLTRVEILESQLTTYGKNMTEDKLREETKRLMSDKESYQTAAKENLKRLVDEKLEASKKLNEVETSLSNLEEEYSSLQQLYDKVVEENKKLSEKITLLAEELAKKTVEETQEMNSLNSSLNRETESLKGSKQELYIENETFSENGSVSNVALTETNGKYYLEDLTQSGSLTGSTDSLDGDSLIEEEEDESVCLESTDLTESEGDLSALLREGNRLRGVVTEMNKARSASHHHIVNLRINLEEAKNENATILQELENTRNKLCDAEKALAEKAALVVSLQQSAEPVQNAEEYSSSAPSSSSSLQEEVSSLRERLRGLQQENDSLKAERVLADSALASKLETEAGKEEAVSGTKQECGLPFQARQEAPGPGPGLPSQAHRQSSCDSCGLSESVLDTSSSATSVLEQSLEEAEARIAGLLQLRDRLVTTQEEKARLEQDVASLSEEVSALAVASRGVTAASLLPLLVLIVALVTAFLPTVSTLLGTKDF